MFYRAKPFLRIAPLWILVLYSMSCDPESRYKMLTFFFDGVPPLHTETEGADEIPAEVDSENPQAVREGTKIRKVLFEHSPGKNCESCHDQSSRKNFSLQVKLKEPLPKLCWRCHSDYENLSGWVHGPVAVGHCLACHNPHRSTEKYLLHEPQPKLCYRCHELTVIESISGHAKESTSDCTRCHQAHAGITRDLLKTNWKEN